jgi:hypothetical protein
MAIQTTYGEFPSAIALEGQLYGGDNLVVTCINKESTASTPFGYAVCFDGSTKNGVLNPDATSDKIRGITVHSHAYTQTELGVGTPGAGTGVKGPLPGAFTDVLVKGQIWVKVEEAVVPGDRLFIRAVATGAEVEGACRKSADSSDCIDSANQGVFQSVAGAGALALLYVDFTGEP